MGTFQLDSRFRPAGDQPEATRQMAEGLETGFSHQTLLRVTGSGKTFNVANVIAQAQCPTLVLAPNKTSATQLYGEFKTFFPHNSMEYPVSYYDYYQPEAYVSSPDTYIEKDPSTNDYIGQMRLLATKALLEHPDAIIVATVSSIYSLDDPVPYLKMVPHLGRGDRIDQHELLRRLTSLRYTHNDVDFAHAALRMRGGVTDILPVESDLEVIRVELLDDEVESLSAFDSLTGEVIRELPRLTFYPRSHYATPRETLLEAVNQIKVGLKKRLNYLHNSNKLVETQCLEQRTRFDLEMILELGYYNGIKNYSRYLSGRAPDEPSPTLYDYLPTNSLLVVDESHVSIPRVGTMLKGDRSHKGTLVEYSFRLPSTLNNWPLCFEEWEAVSPQTVFVSTTPGPYEVGRAERIIEQVVCSIGLVGPEIKVRPAMTRADDLLSRVRQRAARNKRVLVTTLTKRIAGDLVDYLGDHDVRVRYLHSDIDTVEQIEVICDPRAGMLDVLVGVDLLREGLDMPEVSLVTIFDAGKEGFLCSERLLTRIIGRIVRNLHGKTILYTDNVTGSVRHVIDETERRRVKQITFNQVHDIMPEGVCRDIRGILGGAVVPGARDKRKNVAKVAEESGHYKNELRSPSEISKHIHQLEEGMYQLARDLGFKAAVQLCGGIQTLCERLVNV